MWITLDKAVECSTAVTDDELDIWKAIEDVSVTEQLRSEKLLDVKCHL